MSVEVTLALEGAEEFRQGLEKFDVAMQKHVHEHLAEWAENVKTEAMRLVPVRTGYLRSTIYTRMREWTAEVGAEAEYALFVELGTRFTQAKPYLHPAVQERLAELERTVVEALELAELEAQV